MKALILNGHGGLENLELVNDKPLPVAGEGEVLVRVKASAFNYHDVFTVSGMPGIKVPLPVVIGLDIAGDFGDVSEVRELCRRRLPAYQMPAEIVLADGLAKSCSGKILRTGGLSGKGSERGDVGSE